MASIIDYLFIKFTEFTKLRKRTRSSRSVSRIKVTCLFLKIQFAVLCTYAMCTLDIVTEPNLHRFPIFQHF